MENQIAFCYDNVKRNAYLEAKGYKAPLTKKTGTTIAGVMFKDGIVLGADTRATAGSIVCDKNAEKIHYVAPNIYCCGAGTSADTDNSISLVSSQLKLHRYATGKESRVVTAMTLLQRMLWRYQGHISAALVLGGVDSQGAHLYTIYPHGSVDKLPYATMGSGSLAAMAVFEGTWKPGMERAEAMELVHQSILSGIFNDLGSGSTVDLAVLTKGKVDIYRNYDVASVRLYSRSKPYHFPRGTTTILSQRRIKRISEFKENEEDQAAAQDKMEE